jgi:hypothetical protein
MDHHANLRRERESHGFSLEIVPHVLWTDRDRGTGLMDCVSVALFDSVGKVHKIGAVRPPQPELHERHGETPVSKAFAVPVESRDEATREAARYDAYELFAEHVLNAWRGSMSPWEYRSNMALRGTYPSYAHYRAAMVRGDHFMWAAELAHIVGDGPFLAIEQAVLTDYEFIAGPLPASDRDDRLTDLFAFRIADPDTNVEDAIGARFVPELLRKHAIVDGQLACPYCERGFPREKLAIVEHSEPGQSFVNVAWGCPDCTPTDEREITLDRIPTVAAAMRWTIHMLAKDRMLHPVAVRGWTAALEGIFGEEMGLWAEGRL